VSTDSRIILTSLKNRKNNTYLIEKIRTKVKEVEMQNCKIDFTWIKAHAGHHGNELADQLAKEAATSTEIKMSYKRIPNSAVLSELSEQSATKRQGEWDHTTKGAITKPFFLKIVERLKLKINITSNFTTMVTGHGNIKSYLHKYKILHSPMCFCKNREQRVDHISFNCKLLEQKETG
jgi:hypothetical protein